MMRAECLVRPSLHERPWPSTIKTDTMEIDGNNDSGISPGRTSSEANSNSPQSPERTTNNNNNNNHAQYRTPIFYRHDQTYSPPSFVYSRQNDSPRMLRTEECDKEYYNEGCETDDSLERLKMALEKSSALSGIFKSREEEAEASNDADNSQDGGRKEFPCPLCAYSTPYRHRYVEHLGTHYSDKCTLCDFSGQNVQDLRTHLQEVHNLPDIQDLSDPQDNTSDCQDDEEGNGKRGKPKSFKCKQCNYVTTTKLDFWEHSKGHIRAEKLLTCPKCPFVTEYKHHLEYHLRNHFGSKPFKCTKCSYSCVNKSMLNSHLKSHSNVYQYRCADCAYATKYCHSLKLHLRKYQHKPAMVLNSDGSPNPLPIIDVYGTRRGPKQKQAKEDEKNTFLDLKIPVKEKNVDNLPGGIVVPTAPQHISPKSPLNNNEELPCKLFYCKLCPFHTISAEILQQHAFLHAAETNLANMLKTTNNNLQDHVVKEYLTNVYSNPEPLFIDNRSLSPLSLVSPKPLASPKNVASPLDLSKQENYESECETPEPKVKKSRRKGKAYKLERIPEPSPDNFKIKIPEFKPTTEEKTEPNGKADSYTCNFCDISFRDIVMYTMHMGYHGYLDPFTCNMCGHVTTDKVAFFLHIARSSHC